MFVACLLFHVPITLLVGHHPAVWVWASCIVNASLSVRLLSALSVICYQWIVAANKVMVFPEFTNLHGFSMPLHYLARYISFLHLCRYQRIYSRVNVNMGAGGHGYMATHIIQEAIEPNESRRWAEKVDNETHSTLWAIQHSPITKIVSEIDANWYIYEPIYLHNSVALILIEREKTNRKYGFL